MMSPETILIPPILSLYPSMIPIAQGTVDDRPRKTCVMPNVECIGNSNAILPMTTVAGVPPFHAGGTGVERQSSPAGAAGKTLNLEKP
jgi:hypothetical protein